MPEDDGGRTNDVECPLHVDGNYGVPLFFGHVEVDAKSVELLRGILLNDETGREAMGGSVGVRNRAYAAYAMGLIGAKTEDETKRLRIVDTLLIAIGADYSTTRETQVACALSVGLVPLPFKTAGLAAVSVASLPPRSVGILEWFLTPRQLRAIGRDGA